MSDSAQHGQITSQGLSKLNFFRVLMGVPIFQSVLRPVLRPFSRLLLGLVAIPLFRFLLRRILRVQQLDDELEKDLQEWFRASLLLLAATANMEHILFSWLTRVDWLDRADWLTMGLRLLMVIGVIEGMPDQELFAVLHPGPPRLNRKSSLISELAARKWELLKGHLCRHVNRSSPVLAMMCAIVGAQLPMLPQMTPGTEFYEQAVQANSLESQPGIPTDPAEIQPKIRPSATVHRGPVLSPRQRQRLQEFSVSEVEAAAAWQEYKAAEQKYRRDRERWAVGWICYLMAIVQYLIIGLVTSRDRAVDVLNEFDRAVARRRQELIEEFSLDEAEHQQETEVDRSQPADNDSDGPTDPRDTTRESSAAERREPGIE